MGISRKEEKPQEHEIEKIPSIPIGQIMKDLAQGYSLTYSLEGRMARKWATKFLV